MPRWDPSAEWKGQDAYIVGGGDSLSTFDWGPIKGRHTIGCNSDFILGSHIIEIIVFGDMVWFQEIGLPEGIEQYGGRVVGCSNRLRTTARRYDEKYPWLLTMERTKRKEVGKKDLGWYGNTGALAINLALILGARRVYLLGFDMRLGPSGGRTVRNGPRPADMNLVGKANWHDLRYEKSNEAVYPRFIREFEHFAMSMKTQFPGREVWNVTDGSDLEAFPKVPLQEHFGERMKNGD